MADFGPKGITIPTATEEDFLKSVISEAWTAMRRTNWDTHHYCGFAPKKKVQYPIAKGLQSFFENEGWRVLVNETKDNFYFDIYLPEGTDV